MAMAMALLRFHKVGAARDTTFRSNPFPSEVPSSSWTPPPARRRQMIQCALSEVSTSLPHGMGTNTNLNLIELGDIFLQKANESAFSLFPLNGETSWWWMVFGAPIALSYLFATPGSLAGLVDFMYAPLHVRSMRSFLAEDVELGKQLGEGSFGVVYEGFIGQHRKGSKPDVLHVVLKKAKTRVKGVSEIHNSEIYMNYRLQRTASFACAKFLGTLQVMPADAHGKLSEGIWLIWNFQGDRSLDYYLKQRNFPENLISLLQHNVSLKEDASDRNAAVIKTIFKQILKNLQDLHRSGVVHRDVKPLNLILDQNSGTFKFIDFGACVDLRSGFNYVPNETVIDPTYAAPEHYVMPISTPSLPPDPLCSIVSPLLWLLNTPDRFDLYSAGLILVQLCLKSLRQDMSMQTFNAELKRNGYNLNKWRARCHHGKDEFALLDADGGAGWELASALLQPRHDRDQIIWPSLGSSRPTASAALRHRFFHDSAILPRVVSLPNLASYMVPVFEGFALSLSSSAKKIAYSNPQGMKDSVLEKEKNINAKASLFQAMPRIPFSSKVVSSDSAQNGMKENKGKVSDQFISNTTIPKSSLGSKSDSRRLTPADVLKDITSHALQAAFKGPQTSDGEETTTVGSQGIAGVREAAKQKGSSPAVNGAQQSSSVLRPAESALPKLATSAVVLVTGWLVFSGLNSSTQASYEFGKLLMSSTSMSGPAFLAFFLVIKPWLEDYSVALGKINNNEASMGNELQKNIEIEKYRSIHSESIKAQAVADAMQKLDMHMKIFEAQLLEEQHSSHQQKELVQRLQNLLLEPVVAKGMSQQSDEEEECTFLLQQ